MFDLQAQSLEAANCDLKCGRGAENWSDRDYKRRSCERTFVFSHDLPFYTCGCLMAQRKGGRVNHAGSLAITICDPGFWKELGTPECNRFFFRDILKKCGYPQKYHEWSWWCGRIIGIIYVKKMRVSAKILWGNSACIRESSIWTRS